VVELSLFMVFPINFVDLVIKKSLDIEEEIASAFVLYEEFSGELPDKDCDGSCLKIMSFA
jgi:hypothetical protein